MYSHEELCFSTRKQDAKEKIIEWHLLKHGKKDFFQGGTTLIGTETTVMEFCSGGETGLHYEYTRTSGDL